MSSRIETIRARWSGHHHDAEPFASETAEVVLRAHLVQALADIDALLREIDGRAELAPVPISLSFTGNGHPRLDFRPGEPRHECDLGPECPMLRGDS